jgi:antirestriction protein
MKKQKGFLTNNPQLANELAYQIRATQDFNAVITKENIDERALSLACELIGITEANSCRIRAKCRLKPSNPRAPRLYVACLSAYNNGYLHGWWIDADQELDDIWLDIKDMLAESPMNDADSVQPYGHENSGSDVGASEWAIHSYQNFSPISIDEQEDIEEVCQWANLISEHSDNRGALATYISWAKNTGLEITSEEFESRYCGHWQSGQDFALNSEEIEELYNWSQFEKDHHFWSTVIDWEKVGIELELSDEYYYADASESGEYGIYVFRYA